MSKRDVGIYEINLKSFNRRITVTCYQPLKLITDEI